MIDKWWEVNREYIWEHMGAVGEKSREGTQVGLQCRDSHEGFLWADLGSWCLDKASDFPAWNVHGPRETANHRKGGERRKEGGDRAGRGEPTEEETEKKDN